MPGLDSNYHWLQNDYREGLWKILEWTDQANNIWLTDQPQHDKKKGNQISYILSYILQ